MTYLMNFAVAFTLIIGVAWASSLIVFSILSSVRELFEDE